MSHAPSQINGGKWLPILRSLRPHQWVKNVLVFVPLGLAHRLQLDAFSSQMVLATIAFVAFSLTASAIYLINDVVDLETDREHPRKRRRPIASGQVATGGALVLAVALVTAAGLLSYFYLPLEFTSHLALYLLATSVYSLWLKRVALLDVFVLAGLYTLRLLSGGAATDVGVSTWLLAFSMFLFSSLAFVKRYAELERIASEGNVSTGRRGYETSDTHMIQTMGLASGYLAVLVLALYISSTDVQELYPRPRYLWLLCPLLMYWVSRIWLLAKRRRVSEDPVVFASTDPVSWLIGGLAIALVILARLGN